MVAMISEGLAPSGSIQGTWPLRNTAGRPRTQDSSWAQRPRLSWMVICLPTASRTRSRLRGVPLPPTKPMRLCVPSQ